MTIVAEAPIFPNNIVNLIHQTVPTLDDEIQSLRRPIRPTDPNVAVGTFGALWTPDDESHEMRGGSAGPGEPTLQMYRLTIQAFVKDMDEERGLMKHSVLSQMIRAMLYRNANLRVGLAALTVTANGVTERLQRWGITSQRFLSNEVSGNWLYLSTLDFWAETESR